MNEVLFDQLPPLKDLQRVVEEINLGAQAAAGAEPAGRGLLILEQVPHIREGMLACKDWDAVAQVGRGGSSGGCHHLLTRKGSCDPRHVDA